MNKVASTNFKFLYKQGINSMKQNEAMSLASIGVLSACLTIVGVVALLILNVNSFTNFLGAQNEVVVYLLDAQEQTVIDTGAALANHPNVDHTIFVSKEQALEDQMAFLGESGALLEEYKGDANPMPASYRVFLKDLTQLQTSVEEFGAITGVEYVSASQELTTALITLRRAVMYGGGLLIAVLIGVSLIVISNTIRITVFARRKEINIMKFVGATNSYIRTPFLVEGAAIGAISALISFVIVFGAYFALSFYVAKSTAANWLFGVIAGCMLPPLHVSYILFLSFLVAGVFIGSIGSTTSMRRHLKV